jgi:hypothetical protein
MVATKVETNASVDCPVPRFAVEAHLERLFDEEEVHETEEGTLQSPPRVPVCTPCPWPTTKSFGQRTLRRATESPGKGARTAYLQERLPQKDLRLARQQDRDPDATAMPRSKGTTRLGYQTH